MLYSDVVTQFQQDSQLLTQFKSGYCIMPVSNSMAGHHDHLICAPSHVYGVKARNPCRKPCYHPSTLPQETKDTPWTTVSDVSDDDASFQHWIQHLSPYWYEFNQWLRIMDYRPIRGARSSKQHTNALSAHVHGTVASLGVGCQMNCGLIPSTKHPNWPWDQPSLLRKGYQGLFPWTGRMEVVMACSWKLSRIQCLALKMSAAIHQLANMPSWYTQHQL